MPSMVDTPAEPRLDERTGVPKKRTRSGCLPCRRRRRKCDEARPNCRQCEMRRDTCRWGLNVSFHPSRSLLLSKDDIATLRAIDRQREPSQAPGSDRGSTAPESVVIIDDTEEITRYFHRGGNASSSVDGSEAEYAHDIVGESYTTNHHTSDHEPVGLRDVVLRRGDDVDGVDKSNAPGGHDEEHLQFEPLPQGLSTVLMPPDLSFSDPYLAPFFMGQAIYEDASPTPEPDLPVSRTVQASLLTAYLQDTATWCETTDPDMHFSRRSVYAMMESKAFSAAAMALASRQLDTIQGTHRKVTLELYQYTIRLLLRHDPAVEELPILGTCTLLCVYEMMASSVSEWRRHLGGCAGLLKMRGWNGNSQGIIKSCFWAFARIDVWAAFSLGQTTLIPTDSWVHDDLPRSVAEKGDLGDYCNLTILMFARIINNLNDSRVGSSSADSRLGELVQRSWKELQDWRRQRPRTAQPLLRVDASKRSPFPRVIYPESSAICGNTFYHAGAILLLESGLVKADMTSDVELLNPIWHARELGGISVSNTSHANWVNHLQPLYIAGRVFGGTAKRAHSAYVDIAAQQIVHVGPSQDTMSLWRRDTGLNRRDESTSARESPSSETDSGRDGDDASRHDEYAAEKIALLKHLAKIEKNTGWKTSERAKDLRMLWGLEF